METSVLLAQVIGLMYLGFGIGMVLHKSYYKKAFDEAMESKAFMIYGGMIAFAAGFFMVHVHNIWVKDWQVLVTIIGWIALIKGLMLFIMPETMLKISKPMMKKMDKLGFLVVLMGLVFAYFGFYA